MLKHVLGHTSSTPKLMTLSEERLILSDRSFDSLLLHTLLEHD